MVIEGIGGSKERCNDVKNRAGERDRTADLRITSAPLYRLSYTSLAKIAGKERLAKTKQQNRAALL